MCLTENIAALCNHPYACMVSFVTTVPSIMDERAYQGAVHTKIDLKLDRSKVAFERSHSDRFGLRSISDRSNSLV